MPREDVQKIVRDTVAEVLRSLGVDTKNPIETQADFQALREFRTMIRSAKRSAMVALVGIILAAAVSSLWIGFKSFLVK